MLLPLHSIRSLYKLLHSPVLTAMKVSVTLARYYMVQEKSIVSVGVFTCLCSILNPSQLKGIDQVEIETKRVERYEKRPCTSTGFTCRCCVNQMRRIFVSSGKIFYLSTYISACDIGNYWVTASRLDFVVCCFGITARDFNNL